MHYINVRWYQLTIKIINLFPSGYLIVINLISVARGELHKQINTVTVEGLNINLNILKFLNSGFSF